VVEEIDWLVVDAAGVHQREANQANLSSLLATTRAKGVVEVIENDG
jgi:hypothetical protein